MNRKAFYATLRGGVLFRTFTQRQVDAIEPILDEVADWPVPHGANVLAQVYHETGGGMYPVKETVMPHHKDPNPSDEEVIRRLDRAWERRQMTGVRQPYWRAGWFGRGGIQITHLRNYQKLSPIVGVDLVKDPDAALDPVISARIAARGCRLGAFTGKKLSDYDRPGGYDHRAARAIVNGDVPAMGPTIARYAQSFEAALRAAA